MFLLETLIYLAVLQNQFKHVCCASNEADPHAVQHHPFTALEHNGRQMLGLDFTNEPPKTARDRIFRSWVLKDYSKG